MKRVALVLLLMALILSVAAHRPADPTQPMVTIETDRSSYDLGDTVWVTVTNHGPGGIWYGGLPIINIYCEQTGELTWPDWGLPVEFELDPGESEVISWDQTGVACLLPPPGTDQLQVMPGFYRIESAYAPLPVPPVLPETVRVSIEIRDDTPVPSPSWGRFKSFWRNEAQR